MPTIGTQNVLKGANNIMRFYRNLSERMIKPLKKKTKKIKKPTNTNIYKYNNKVFFKFCRFIVFIISAYSF